MLSRHAVALVACLSFFGSPICAADLHFPRSQPALSSAGAERLAEMKGIWGAIAYSVDDATHGFTWGTDKLEDAQRDAIAHCENAGGKSCRVVTLFRNHRQWDDDDRSGFPYLHCAALTRGSSKRAWGAAPAETRAEAEEKALQICKRRGGDCQLIEWVCT